MTALSALTGAATSPQSTAATSAVIVATPAASDPVQKLSDSPHVTLFFLGQAADITAGDRADLVELLRLLASAMHPFEVSVSGAGRVGHSDQPILMVESEPLSRLHQLLASEPLVAELTARVEQHPTWMPHLSTNALVTAGRPETITIGAVELWLAGEKLSFPFKTSSVRASGPLPEELVARENYVAEIAQISDRVFCVPVLTSAAQLQSYGIKYADQNPKVRPFVIKFAAQADALHLIPNWPEIETTVIHRNGQSARLTAGGALVAAGSGLSLREPARPTRRQRGVRLPAKPRVIRDKPDLLVAIRRASDDPTERQNLVILAEQMNCTRWIPATWTTAPTEPAPLAPEPGSADDHGWAVIK